MPDICPAVILGTFHTALAIGRSLGRKRIPVYAFDFTGRNSAGASRFIKYLEGPSDEQELYAALVELAERLGRRPVLFIASDTYLEFLLRYQDELRPHYSFYPLRREVEALILSKRGLAQIFADYNVPHPQTWVFRRHTDPQYDQVRPFPVILKPNFHDRWLRNEGFLESFGQKKVFVARCAEDLRELAPRLLGYDDLIVQECIPGPSTNLFYYIGVRDKAGRFLVSFVGNKLRTYPEGLGSEVLFQPVKNVAVRRLAEGLLAQLDFNGIAGVDIKFDARTGEFRVIEINCRFGLSDGLVGAAGVDLPYIAYLDLIGEHAPEMRNYRTDVRWYWFEPNIDWFRDHATRKTLSLRHMLTDSVRYKYDYLLFATDDLAPFLQESRRFGQRLLKGLISRGTPHARSSIEHLGPT